jgi:hypothetical protein
MSKLKDFLVELSKSLQDIETARKISNVRDKEIVESYLCPLQQKHGLGTTLFTTSNGQLIIHMSRKYEDRTIEITAKDKVELAKFLQKKGIKTDSFGLYIDDGQFDYEKNTIRIGIPDSKDFHSYFRFRPKDGGIIEIDYTLLTNPLAYEIAEYIENNLVKKETSILCCVR